MFRKVAVEFWGQDYREMELKGVRPFQAEWDFPRILRKSITLTVQEGYNPQQVAEQMFHLFNAPDELIPLGQRRQRGSYEGPSMSVGDVVKIRDTDGTLEYALLCKGLGWEVQSFLVEIC